MTRFFFLITCISFAALPALPAKEGDERKPMSERKIERMRKRNHRHAQEAWARDKKNFRSKKFEEMEKDYQEINDKYREPESAEIIERFLKKYKTGNRVGCATMYLAQKSRGKDRENLLKKAIADFSDCYYLNGCCVGGIARLYLAGYYQQTGDKSEAEKLVKEIEKDYATAQDHRKNPIIDQLGELGK